MSETQMTEEHTFDVTVIMKQGASEGLDEHQFKLSARSHLEAYNIVFGGSNFTYTTKFRTQIRDHASGDFVTVIKDTTHYLQTSEIQSVHVSTITPIT